jgi:Domain of unknown function (DUF4837)
MRNLLLLLVSAGFLIGCGGKNPDNLPKAAGASGDIYLFMDSTQWKGELGGVVDSLFNQEMIGLPREEGIFRMSYVDPRKLNFVLKQRRNLIFVMTLDNNGPGSQIVKSLFTPELLAEIAKDSSLFTQTYKDVYAKDQQVMFLFAQNEAQMKAKLLKNGQRLIDYFDKVERDRMNATLFQNGTMTGVNQWLSDNFHAGIKIPFGYKLVQNEPDFVWLRQINSADDKDIFIAKTKYLSEDQFTLDSLIRFRNKVARKYLFEDPEKQNTYLVTETSIPYKPVTMRRVNFNGNFAVEIRGLWRTNTASMGGPFMAYAIADPSTGEFYYIEGFVYGPSKEQREMMRQMEVVLNTFKLDSWANTPAKAAPRDSTTSSQ